MVGSVGCGGGGVDGNGQVAVRGVETVTIHGAQTPYGQSVGTGREQGLETMGGGGAEATHGRGATAKRENGGGVIFGAGKEEGERLRPAGAKDSWIGGMKSSVEAMAPGKKAPKASYA